MNRDKLKVLVCVMALLAFFTATGFQAFTQPPTPPNPPDAPCTLSFLGTVSKLGTTVPLRTWNISRMEDAKRIAAEMRVRLDRGEQTADVMEWMNREVEKANLASGARNR